MRQNRYNTFIYLRLAATTETVIITFTINLVTINFNNKLQPPFPSPSPPNKQTKTKITIIKHNQELIHELAQITYIVYDEDALFFVSLMYSLLSAA